MASNTIKARHVVCAKTASEWASYSVVPLKGEVCLETDTNKFKFGNGKDVYADLPYVSGQVAGDGTWTSATESGGTTTVSHTGPGAKTSTAATEGSVAAFANATGIVTDVSLDAKGHVTGVTKENATNVVTMASAAGAADHFVATGGANRTVKDSALTKTTTVASSSTDSQIPTAKAVMSAIDTALTSALTYKGTKAYAGLPATGNKVGDMYALTDSGTSPVVYDVGDYVIWNGTGWDLVQHTVAVENGTAALAWDTDVTVGTVEGVDITAKLPANPVSGISASSPTASGTDIAFIDTVSQTAGKITATKKTVRTASTTQTGVVQLQDSVDTTATTAATPNAVKKAIDAYDPGTKLTDLAATLTSATATSATANNATLNMSVKAFGKTATATLSASTSGLPTSLLMDDPNVVLIVDGNF